MSLVYVADDEPEIAALLCEAIAEDGHEVVASTDGASLLSAVEDRLPDLILLDINMPGMSGWEVRRKLLERAEWSGIPVIAVTAQGGASIETSAKGTLGFRAFVRKPFSLVDVLARVDDALNA